MVTSLAGNWALGSCSCQGITGFPWAFDESYLRQVKTHDFPENAVEIVKALRRALQDAEASAWSQDIGSCMCIITHGQEPFAVPLLKELGWQFLRRWLNQHSGSWCSLWWKPFDWDPKKGGWERKGYAKAPTPEEMERESREPSYPKLDVPEIERVEVGRVSAPVKNRG